MAITINNDDAKLLADSIGPIVREFVDWRIMQCKLDLLNSLPLADKTLNLAAATSLKEYFIREQGPLLERIAALEVRAGAKRIMRVTEHDEKGRVLQTETSEVRLAPDRAAKLQKEINELTALVLSLQTKIGEAK